MWIAVVVSDSATISAWLSWNSRSLTFNDWNSEFGLINHQAMVLEKQRRCSHNKHLIFSVLLGTIHGIQGINVYNLKISWTGEFWFLIAYYNIPGHFVNGVSLSLPCNIHVWYDFLLVLSHLWSSTLLQAFCSCKTHGGSQY